MDPSTLMNEGANTASFNLAEIWRFPINGGSGGESSGGGGRFAALFNANLEVSRSGGGGVAARRKREAPEDDSANGMSDRDSKRLKASGSRDENHNSKADDEVGSGEGAEQSSKPAPEPLKDYIHVRARRGQATDSHSLAERARREKISERMRILQDLVPGCNKIIGKALVLDEIINYIQSLQRQVEFLSMKLEAVNARISPAIEGYPTKDYIQQAYDASGTAYNSQAPREYVRGSSPEWLHMQVGGGFDRQSFDRQT